MGHNAVIFVGRADKLLYEEIFKDLPLEFCLSVSKNKNFLSELNAAEHEWCHLDLINEINWNKVDPLDEELIEKMCPCETVVLPMFDRLEGGAKVITFQERKRRYLKILRYANHILVNNKIDVVLSMDVPHHALSYTFFSLCKKHGIPYLFARHVDPFPDAFYLQEDWKDPVPVLRERFLELKKTTDPSSVHLSEPFQKYFDSQTGEKSTGKEDRTPWYMKGKKKSIFGKWIGVLKRGPAHFLWNAILFIPRRLRPSFIRNRVGRLLKFRNASKAFSFYDSHTTLPDLTRKYIYVPLQMQPESTTLPRGGAYVNQELIIQMLDAHLPDDVLICVKEHPKQEEFSPSGRCRPIEFYKDLLKCKKVRLVPKSFDSFSLTENSVAIATATGTAGLEALFLQKPVLLFGHIYFQYAPGVFAVRTSEDCRKAINSILVDGVKPDLADVRLFLKAVEETVIEGVVGKTRLPISRFSPEENAVKAGEAIRGEIERRLSAN